MSGAADSDVILEFRHILEFLLGGSRKHNFGPCANLQRLVRDGHEMAADSEESADLQDRKKHAVLADDQIIDRADSFVLSDRTVCGTSPITPQAVNATAST